MLEARQQLFHLARKRQTGPNPIDCMVLHKELQDAIFEYFGQKVPQLDRNIFGVPVFSGTNNDQVFCRATMQLPLRYNRIAYSIKNEGEGGGWEIKVIDCEEIRSRYAVDRCSIGCGLKIDPIKWD